MTNEKVDLEKLDNPVKRLHQILEKARPQSGNVASRYVWADALGIDRNDLVSLYRALIDLHTLFHIARRSVGRLEDVNRDHYLKPFDNIEKVITDCDLNQPWSRQKKLLDDITMLTLELASNTVSAEAGKPAIGEEVLKDLQAETENLLERVLSTDFSSEELKTVLVDHLESICKAILAYRVSGTEGLRRAVESALGALFLHQEQIKNVTQQEEKKKRVFQDFFNLLGNISQVASLGLQVLQLTGVITPLLGPGGS